MLGGWDIESHDLGDKQNDGLLGKGDVDSAKKASRSNIDFRLGDRCIHFWFGKSGRETIIDYGRINPYHIFLNDK